MIMTRSIDIARIAVEFPHFPAADIPVDVPDFIDCQACINDACPLWGVKIDYMEGDHWLNLGTDYVDPTQRELPHGRYIVWVSDEAGDADDSVTLYDGDDWAAAKLALWAAYLGLGFHPDTRGRDYVHADGSRCFTDAQAAAYDADMHDAHRNEGDPYEAGIAVWQALGLIPPDDAASGSAIA